MKQRVAIKRENLLGSPTQEVPNYNFTFFIDLNNTFLLLTTEDWYVIYFIKLEKIKKGYLYINYLTYEKTESPYNNMVTYKW